MSSPAIFLDRDGVLIENVAEYVRSWSDVRIFPSAIDALARRSHLPHRILIITNQSVVGRGLISLADAEAINARLVETIRAAGGRVDGVFMCPHAPEDGCACRKPRPGLLLQARAELDLDLAGSLLIGDALEDIQAAHAAGVSRAALVRTGRGAFQEAEVARRSHPRVSVFADLAEALTGLLGENATGQPGSA
jgi:D-glycero-D-manno-heptose 1,7-bisphosphate phosphatase